MYLFAVHFLDGINSHGFFHELDSSSVELVISTFGNLDAKDESERFKESLEFRLSSLWRETTDDKTGIVMHILFVPRLVINLDFLSEQLLMVHHLDSLKSCLGRAVLYKPDSSRLLGNKISLDLNLWDFSEVLEGLEEHSFVYLWWQVDNKDFLTLGPLYLGHL